MHVMMRSEPRSPESPAGGSASFRASATRILTISEPARVDVWSARLEAPPQQLEELRRLLSNDEIERAGRYRSPRLARRFVVRRGLLRLLIGEVCGVEPDTIRFATAEHGKPHLAAPEAEARFSVSHSDDLALFAITGDDAWIGVDVERLRPVADRDAIASRFFAPEEVDALTRLPPTRIDGGFLRCWTRKEAYLKAMGTGLSVPLAGFAVSVDAERPRVLRRLAGDHGSWTLADPDPPGPYVACLAVAATSPNAVTLDSMP